MTDKELVRSILRDMLNYYYENIGKSSKYTGDIITPKMVSRVTERYLELGGKLTSEKYEIGEEGEAIQEVWMLWIVWL